MNDLISRQAAIDATWFEPSYTDPLNVLTEVRDRLKALPSAQPERKKGWWIPQDHNHTHGNVSTCVYFSPVCSECGHTGDFNMDFCPNCGAKMEE